MEAGTLSEARAWILDADTLEIHATLQTHRANALAFTPDSSALLVAGRTAGLVRWFDARTGAPLTDLQAHEGLVNGLDFSPDGTRLATVGGDEGDIIVWDTTVGPPYKPVARFHERGFVGSAKWDSSGRRLIGACDTTIRIWDDVPLRERVAMREARATAMSRVRPIVERLYQELLSPELVMKRVRELPDLSALESRAATQVVIDMSLEAASARPDAARSSEVDGVRGAR